MSLLSKLFGKGDEAPKGTKLDPEVRKIFEKIERLLRDDDAQLELLDPEIRDVLKRAPFYDKSPDGSGPFGLCITNPIPANGPVGELAYLSNLVTSDGERILFHRIGTAERIDIYEAVTFSGDRWFLFYLDMYHPKKSRLAPAGFVISKESRQLSGFNNHCADFPYDFAEMRHRSALGPAYMPMGDITRALGAKAYERPAGHIARLRQLEHGATQPASPTGEAQTPSSKADYYSLIARAVSELTINDGEARQALYTRARVALDGQLRGRPGSEIMSEQRALAAAIHRVEDELTQVANQKARFADTHEQKRKSTLDEAVGESASLVGKLLSLQLIPEDHRLPDFLADDKFRPVELKAAVPLLMANKIAAGYVFGFIDSYLQTITLVDQLDPDAGFRLIWQMYQSIFGDEAGLALFNLSFSLRDDPIFQRGRQNGGTEAAKFLRLKMQPLGLGRILVLGLEE